MARLPTSWLTVAVARKGLSPAGLWLLAPYDHHLLSKLFAHSPNRVLLRGFMIYSNVIAALQPVISQ